MSTPWTALEIITTLDAAQQPALEAALARWNFHRITLDGAGVTDAASLWAAAAESFALERLPRRWSSFVDGLWGALGELGEPRVALLWTSAERMLAGGLSDLLLAADSLTDLARQAYDPTESGFSHEMVLKVFLLGTGPNFPAIPLSDD